MLPGCSGLATHSNSTYLLSHTPRKCLLGIIGNSRQGRASEKKGEPKRMYSIIVPRHIEKWIVSPFAQRHYTTLHQKDDARTGHRGHTLHRVSHNSQLPVAFSARQEECACADMFVTFSRITSAILHMSFPLWVHGAEWLFVCRGQCCSARSPSR